jgi:hypothetical protein
LRFYDKVAEPAVTRAVAGFCEAAIRETLGQSLRAARLQVMVLGPRLPRREQVRNAAKGKLSTILSTIIQPLLQRVLGGEVLLGSVMYDGGRREADPLPLQATLDAPAQDCRPLGLEPLS